MKRLCGPPRRRVFDSALRPKPLLFAGLLLAIVFLSGFGPPVLLDRPYAPTERVTIGDLRYRAAAVPPPTSAAAYLVYDVAADQILFAYQPEAPLAPASLTKLMTALLVLEQGHLLDTVTIRGSDLVGEASMGLQAGEQLTVQELLWGLLIPSGNDAALALARTTAGDVATFVDQMNARARQLGLRHTHFANPHGLDAPGQESSAADLLTVTRRLWTYPLFRQIAGTAETTVAGHTLRNTNELLGTLSGANGVKTGTSTAAGECLVASIQREDRQVLVVILGSRDRYHDLRSLDAFYEATYHWTNLDRSELTALNRIYGPGDELWYLRTIGAPTPRLIRSWEILRLRTYRRLDLPTVGVAWKPGMEVGALEWWLGDERIASQTLVLW